MKKIHQKQILGVIVAALASPSVLADYSVVYAYDANGAKQFKSMVTESATNPITKVFAQVTDGLKNVLVQSNAEIATQMENRNIEAIKKQRAAQSMQEQQPAMDACGDQTGAAYAQSVVEISDALKKNFSARAQNRSGNAPAAPEQTLQVNKIHETYCDSATAPGGKCDKPPKKDSVAGDNIDLKNADVSADKSLFAGNLTHTPDQTEATQHFIANIVDSGDAPRKPTKNEASTPEGQKYEGLRQVYLARMSMAQSALSDISSIRAELPGAREILDEIRAGSPVGGASYIIKRESLMSKIFPFWPGKKISALELMDIEVGRRADNPDWYESVNSQMSPAALAKEQTLMMAMMLKMQYRMFRQGELQSAMNAQQAVEAAKSGMRDKLNTAEQAMIRGESK